MTKNLVTSLFLLSVLILGSSQALAASKRRVETAKYSQKKSHGFWERPSINFVEMNNKRYGNKTKSDRVSSKKAARKKLSTKKRRGKKVEIKSVVQKQKSPFRKYTENFSFNYNLQYLGRSLSDEYQEGATYNRFKTGQDYKGDAQDATGSYQMYHAITLAYQLARDYKLSYSYTFQDDLNKDIKYKAINEDGSSSEYTRAKGVSDNNKRLNLFVANVVNTKNFYINTNYFYEFASTVNSEGQDMEYGVGFEPSINFYHDTAGLHTGFTSSVQRNYYKKQDYFQKCGTVNCKYPTKYQTLLLNVGAYANYALNDEISLKSSITVDWDQKGNEVESAKVFNKNMDDVARIGIDFNIDYGVVAGTFLEFGIEDPSVSKTAIGANLSISLY